MSEDLFEHAIHINPPEKKVPASPGMMTKESQELSLLFRRPVVHKCSHGLCQIHNFLLAMKHRQELKENKGLGLIATL